MKENVLYKVKSKYLLLLYVNRCINSVQIMCLTPQRWENPSICDSVGNIPPTLLRVSLIIYDSLRPKSYVALGSPLLLPARNRSESKQSIFMQYCPRNFQYYVYSFYIMIKVIKCVLCFPFIDYFCLKTNKTNSTNFYPPPPPRRRVI